MGKYRMSQTFIIVKKGNVHKTPNLEIKNPLKEKNKTGTQMNDL